MRRWIEQNPEWKVCGEAENGAAGVEKAKELKPDLVILDLSMPVMNGIEAARCIKEFDPAIPLLMFTMYIYEQLVQDAYAAGVKRVISKTDGVMEQLITTIADLLQPSAA